MINELILSTLQISCLDSVFHLGKRSQDVTAGAVRNDLRGKFPAREITYEQIEDHLALLSALGLIRYCGISDIDAFEVTLAGCDLLWVS